MEKIPSFVVPAGVVFEIAEDGLTIQHDGDIVLHTTFGRALKSVVSRGGSVAIHADVQGGTVAAHGSVTVAGSLAASSVEAGGDVEVGGGASVDSIVAGGSVRVGGDTAARIVSAGGDVALAGAASADTIQSGGRVSVAGAFGTGVIRGADIDLQGPTTARGLQATGSVQLGPVKISVDAILAREVHVQAGTSGRAPLVECQNDLGPNALKGKFRLADWEETFGDPLPYLTERGLSLPGGAPPVALPPSVAQVEVADEPEAVEEEAPVAAPVAEEPPPAPPVAEEPPPAPEVVAAAAPPPAPAMEVEIEESEDVSMTATLPPTPPEHPLHGDLLTAVNKIVDCYGDSELPPAVYHLRERIEARAYDQVRAEITTIWSDLLKFHQKKGLRIQHQVTTTFNTINSLVKKM